MKPLFRELPRDQLPGALIPFLDKQGPIGSLFALTPDQLGKLTRLGKQLRVFQKGCNDLYALSSDGRQPEWVAHLMDRGQKTETIELRKRKEFRNHIPPFFRVDWSLSEKGFILTDFCFDPGEKAEAARLQSQLADLGLNVVGGKNGITDSATSADPEKKTLLEERLWFALLFLRPLKPFWRRVLSDRHLESLLGFIPRSWAVDPAPLPPQAEISGLSVQNFLHLREAAKRTPGFLLRPSRTTHAPSIPAYPLLTPDSPDEWVEDVMRRALDRFEEMPYVLSALPERDGASAHLRAYYGVRETEVHLAGVFHGTQLASKCSGSDLVWMPMIGL